MIARLGWMALGVAVGILGGRVVARRTEAEPGPPVLAAATRVALGATPAGGPAEGPASGAATTPATEAPVPATEVPDPATEVPDPAPPERPTVSTARPTPAPWPRPRPEPSGRHAWVPPEESGPDPQQPPG
ncbi:hypothetical protein GCM10027047_25050 [Rhodococcus aerolatus]